MRTSYYPLLLNQVRTRLSGDKLRCALLSLLFCCSLLVGQNVLAQFGSDLGKQAVSSLAWADISSHYKNNETMATIGLTTDGRVYTWGANLFFTIHANRNGTSTTLENSYQVTPYKVLVPGNEAVKKVRMTIYEGATYNYANTFFCLTASGKMCAWGINAGLVGTVAGWTLGTPPSYSDTTRAKRSPVPLTILGESEFVDFDVAKNSYYWVAIGASGKAYHIGDGGAVNTTTFGEISKPTGADASFKYTNVWVGKVNTALPNIYLKGNDGKIYYTGGMGSVHATGVPSLFPLPTPPTLTANETNGKVTLIAPREVPFPAGEDIIDIKVAKLDNYATSFAIAASGKAYAAGVWRISKRYIDAAYTKPEAYYTNYVLAPLKTVPTATDEFKRNPTGTDSLFYLNKFVEMAMPPGATKIMDIMWGREFGSDYHTATLVAGDNGKVYWTGKNDTRIQNTIYAGNFLSLVNFQGEKAIGEVGEFADDCKDVLSANSISRYSWTYEAVNYAGAKKLIKSGSSIAEQFFVISQSGRGYVVGQLAANAGLGKTSYGNDGTSSYFTFFPVPIANELLLSCNTSPGTGGPLGDPAPAAGTIDCSKTQLYPAPVQGTPSKLSLLVTVNVTTAGLFSPITVSGSGMSLPAGFSSLTVAATGVQTLHIPINYDGSTLTNAFQFTIGQAGSCAADLTKESKKAIVDVWTLECVPSVGPMLKK
ncbi:hypothetical protein [Runella limosa]|uniref:hypothetical protein n=1 Tax=Runella limosa TaxID=370978 RepID=UPI0012FCF092|nr:hypothetical protein [Runella limosa]